MGSTSIVGNRSEIIALSDKNENITTCAENVLEKYGAEVVIAKCGASGVIVADSNGISMVGAFPTFRVDPIGSGDVFSAVFATHWAEQNTSAIDAAGLASKATATWVSKGPLQVMRKSGHIIPPDLDIEASFKPTKTYLAGPFFNLTDRWLVNLCRNALAELGGEVFSPFHDVGLGSPDVVAPADLENLNTSNSVLALLDGLDSGTIYEVGYASAKGIPVVGFSSQKNVKDLTMLIGTNIPIYSDLSTAVYNSIWSGIQNQRLLDDFVRSYVSLLILTTYTLIPSTSAPGTGPCGRTSWEEHCDVI